MAESLNYRASDRAMYYVPPHQLAPTRMLIALSLAVIACAAGAYLYVQVFRRLDNIYFCVGGVAFAAVATGMIAFVAVQYGKVTSNLLAAFIGSFLGLLTLYVMWIVWLHSVIDRLFLPSSNGWRLLIMHPSACLRLIRIINREGTWKIDGDQLKGIPLLLCWMGEAGAILASTVFMSIKAVGGSDPVCWKCGVTCKRVKGLPRFAAERVDELVGVVESRDFNSLASYPLRNNEDDPELALTLFSCPSCGESNVLVVNRIAWTVENGKAMVKTMPLVKGLLISREEAGQVKDLAKLTKRDDEGADTEART